MGCLVLLILLVVLAGAGVWFTIGLTLGLVGLALTLLVAGLVGWAADQLIPGRLPGGWIGAVLTGILGGFVGHLVFSALHIGRVGPIIFGIDVVPAFVGAVVIAAVAQMLTTRRSPTWS
jgi:uncharacterized membrane protein YeaQ/YmgE (transglycosylase-associated protein family)